MIGTFWNLCRACPSIPTDKTRSEYRSTYQWYEYTGHRHEVVKQAPQLISPTKNEETSLKGGIQATLINVNKSDSKRYRDSANALPEVNIKKNPIFDREDPDLIRTNDNDTRVKVTDNTGVRVRSRYDRRDYTSSRRSKSEGPPGAYKRSYYAVYGSPSSDHAGITDVNTEYGLIANHPEDNDVDTADIPVKDPRGNTEYRLQFAWPKSKHASDTEELKTAANSSRRSAFMSATGQDRPPVPVHKKRLVDANKKDGASELEPLVDQNGECDNNEEKKEKAISNERLEFHTEYKKNFRPFSQYDYISGKYKDVNSASDLTSGNWYAEVIELRKKAGEYKHRGWGTELVPQHLAEVYNKQIALWEHVSRRSSLSALTLATTTQKPRALTKEEKSKENSRKVAPHKFRDARQVSVDRATSILRRKTEKNEEIKRHSVKSHKDALTKQNVTASTVTTTTPISTGHSQITGSTSGSGSPKKYMARSTSVGSPKKTVVIQNERRARPTSLATSAHTRIKRDTSASAIKKDSLKPKISPTTAKVIHHSKKSDVEKKSTVDTIKTDEIAAIEKGEVEENFAEIERIVKSPPEPTRVKSPEQMMINSPEPVNWTVPLDTGKMFTVTQNIHDGDIYHHRPPSETKTISFHYHEPSSLSTDNQSVGSHKDEGPASLSYSDKLSDKEFGPEVNNKLDVEKFEREINDRLDEEFVPEVNNELTEEFESLASNKLNGKFETDVHDDLYNEFESGVSNKLDEKVEPEVNNERIEEFEPKVSNKFNGKFGQEVDNELNEEFESLVTDKLNGKFEHGVHNKLNDEFESLVSDKLNGKFEQEVNNELNKEFESLVGNKLSEKFEREVNNGVNKEFETKTSSQLNEEFEQEVNSELNKESESKESNALNALNEKFEQEIENKSNKEFEVEMNNTFNKELESEVNNKLGGFDVEMNNKLNKELETGINNKLDYELETQVNFNFGKEFAQDADNKFIDKDFDREIIDQSIMYVPRNEENLDFNAKSEKFNENVIKEEVSSSLEPDSKIKSVEPMIDSTSGSGPISEHIASAETLDSARDRFDQFWSKPKYEVNGKESAM